VSPSRTMILSDLAGPRLTSTKRRGYRGAMSFGRSLAVAIGIGVLLRSWGVLSLEAVAELLVLCESSCLIMSSLSWKGEAA